MHAKGDRNLKVPELFISAKGLKGKQSVRTTFRLPAQIIDLLGVVASQLGLKQKSLFDQLIENKDVLSKVAENMHNFAFGSEERRSKTFVLSRKSLEVLDEVAQQKNISRDALVAVSIQRLLPVMTAEKEKNKKRAKIFDEMKNYLDQGEEILRKADKTLGAEDQVFRLLKKNINDFKEDISKVAEIINRGESIKNIKTPSE